MTRRLSKKKVKRVLAHLGANSIDQAMEMLPALARAIGETGNEQADADFEGVLAACGRRWAFELQTLSMAELHVPRVLALSLNEEGEREGEWETVGVYSGVIAAANVTIDSLTAHMDDCLVESDGGEVAVWLMAADAARNEDSPGHLGYMRHTNGTGIGLLFRGPDVIRIPADDRLAQWLGAVLSGVGGAAHRRAVDVTEALQTTLRENLKATGKPKLSADKLAEFVREQLPEKAVCEALRMLTEFYADGFAEDLTTLLDYTYQAMAVSAAASRQFREDAEADFESKLAKRLKKLQADLEKSELMAKGARARADRADAELKELRKQMTRAGAGGAVAGAEIGVAGGAAGGGDDAVAVGLARLFAGSPG